MKNSKLAIIIIAAALIVFGAYESSRNVVNHTSRGGVANGAKLLPDLESNMDNVGTVIIRSKGKSFKVHLEDGEWVMPNKFFYPVPVEKIRDLVQSSAAVTILEKKTSQADAMAELGLDDPELESSSAIRIALLSADEKTTYADYIRGINRKGVSGGEGKEVYARLFTDNQAYLVYGDLNFDLGAHTLLSGETFSVTSDKFKTIAFNYPNNTGYSFTIGKNIPGQPDFEIFEPKDNKIKSAIKAETIGRMLEYVKLEDILPAENFALINAPELSITYETFNGLTLVVTLFKSDKEIWLTFKASAEEKNEKSSEEAARLNNLASKWVYKISSDNAEGFNYKLSDLTKE